MNNCGSQLAIKSKKGKWDDDITEYGVQRHLYSWLCEVKEVGLILYNKCIDELGSINICWRQDIDSVGANFNLGQWH